ncbi:MAG: hypothetical protein EOO34_00615 [Cyanobacteriota bacterium]|nr:MAG: hypothetical protein EOO34_00615 [Cyanobacteriota bacterium]
MSNLPTPLLVILTLPGISKGNIKKCDRKKQSLTKPKVLPLWVICQRLPKIPLVNKSLTNLRQIFYFLSENKIFVSGLSIFVSQSGSDIMTP